MDICRLHVLLSREIAWFFFVSRGFRDFFVLRDYGNFCLSQEVAWFFCPQRFLWFILAQKVSWFFFCPERLFDFFVSRECRIFSPKMMHDCFFCLKRLHDFFLSLEVAWFFIPRGCVIFILSQEVACQQKYIEKMYTSWYSCNRTKFDLAWQPSTLWTLFKSLERLQVNLVQLSL